MADQVDRRPTKTSDSISVVIPTVDEEDRIGETIRQFEGTDVREVIVVDGGSNDATVELATAEGARVLQECANRGRQQNTGAQHSKGEILLFLHADTTLPRGFADQVRDTLSDSRVCAGAFRFGTDDEGWQMRLVEWMVALRCRLFGMPYGDQAIFLSKDAFRRVGGFTELQIMEDFDLIRRLKRIGRVELAPGRAITSARRWRQEGLWRLTWAHQLCILGYYLGVPPARLERFRRAAS